MSALTTADKLKAVERVSRDPALKASDKLVYMRLVWHLNLKTGQCFPSLGTIASALSLTERAVRGCMKRLESHGSIRRLVQPGRNKSNRYLVRGLCPERAFQESGKHVPQNRNEASSDRIKEKKKEKAAGGIRDRQEFAPLCKRQGCLPAREEGRPENFHASLAMQLGGNIEAWDLLLQVPAELLDTLGQRVAAEKMDLPEAVEEIMRHFEVAISHAI